MPISVEGGTEYPEKPKDQSPLESQNLPAQRYNPKFESTSLPTEKFNDLQIKNLQTLRDNYIEGKFDDRTFEHKRLEFGRWLYRNGRIFP